VEIRPNDYAQDAVVGELVGYNDVRCVVSRETQQFGTVHVHFPIEGFDIKRVA